MTRSGLAASVVIAVAMCPAGCSSDGTDVPPDVVGHTLPEWTANPLLDEVYRVGRLAGASHETFGEIAGATFIDDRLALSDAQADRIHMFDSSGRYLTSLGGAGRGPGEFTRVGPLVALPDGGMVALDAGGGRLQFFDSSGGPVETESLSGDVERMCGVGSMLFLLGQRRGTDAPIHVLGPESDEWSSMGPTLPVDTESRHRPVLLSSLVDGQVGCFGSMIVYARSSDGTVTAVDLTGRVLWETAIPGFVPMEHEIDEGRGVRHGMPEGATEVNAFGQVVQLDGALFVQVLRGNSTDGAIGVSTIVIEPSSGRLLGVNHGIPQILATTDGRAAVLLENSFPEVAVHLVARR